MTRLKLKIGFLWVLLGAFPVVCYAQMPKSIKYVEELTSDEGTTFVHFEVTCANGNVVAISSWNNNKLWCEGKGKKDNCHKKKIKTAKMVCKS